MNRKNTARNALITSIISMLLCVSMLVSTTFAWFTDEVTSTGNKIQAGTLKIDLELLKDGTWVSIKENPQPIFNYENWEPGYTDVHVLRVVNKGSLNLKWVAKLASEAELSDLANVIDVYVNTSATEMPADRAAVESWTKVGTVAEFVNTINETTNGNLAPQAVAYMGIALKMQETAGNKYQGAALGEFDIQIFATQYTEELDSFDKYYDEGAAWTGAANTDWYFADPEAAEFTLNTAEELAGLAKLVNGTATAPATTYALRSTPETVKDDFKGQTILLGANINLNDVKWTPIGTNENPFRGNFDGQGYTVSNLFVSNEGWSGLIGHAGLGSAVTIKNVNVDGATIFTNRMAGAVVGQIYGNIENCHVNNVTIKAVPNAVGNTYDNGDKVGGIVGWLGDNGNNRVIANCSATNVKIGAYRDVAAIAGYVASSTTISGCAVTNAEIVVDQSTNYYGDKEPNAGLFYGRAGGTIVDENNTADEASTVESTYSKNGLTLKKDGVTGEVALYLVPAAYAEATVTVPEGVDTIGGYAFAYNTNVEKIVLSSTVTTLNDRAFRDTSASTVVLNEGLENISYQAFRNAANITAIEIPSTVKTISREAFQNSGITTLTIPANVTTVEYGACRDMKFLEKVTIESAATIPAYAFRSCTNLKTVVLANENVTFEKGMIFTHYDSGISEGMTVYVATEEVKARLQAADSSAKYYEIVVAAIADSDASAAEQADDIATALGNGENVLLTESLSFSADDTTANSGYGATGVSVKGGILDGNGYALGINNWDTWDAAVHTNGGTIKNLTINSGMRGIFMGGAEADVYIDNVTIDGTVYTFNSDGGNTAYGVYITNSTLNGWTSFSNVHKEVVFTDCNFGEGSGYAFCRPYNVAVFKNCVFEEGFQFDTAAAAAGAITFENCYYGETLITAENALTLTANGNTFFYNGLNGTVIR